MATTLSELIDDTEAAAPADAPLERLSAAARRQGELADLGEQLLDHFVQQAREAGCSWTRIGTALGVSKQAAQQRHSSVRSLLGGLRSAARITGAGLFSQFTNGAPQVALLAQEAARDLGHRRLGTEHLLLGLLRNADPIAARALTEAGLDHDAAVEHLTRLAGRGDPIPKGHLPFTPRAKKVLELSLRESRHLGHDQVGPEHILLGLLRDGDGLGAQVLVTAGIESAALRRSVTERLAATG